MQHKMHISQLNFDLDSEEIPEIIKVSSSLDYDSEPSVSDQNRLSTLETEIETHLEQIKKLKTENDSIQKERDEVLEEYDDELKAVKSENEYLERENIEIKQEIKILYSRVEELQNENEKLQNLVSRNRELELIAAQNKVVINQLQDTNKLLTNRVLHSNLVNIDNQEVNEKSSSINTYNQEQAEEIERLRRELIEVNIRYAETQTDKGMLQKKLNDFRTVDHTNPNRFSWKFWKFWKNS